MYIYLVCIFIAKPMPKISEKNSVIIQQLKKMWIFCIEKIPLARGSRDPREVLTRLAH